MTPERVEEIRRGAIEAMKWPPKFQAHWVYLTGDEIIELLDAELRGWRAGREAAAAALCWGCAKNLPLGNDGYHTVGSDDVFGPGAYRCQAAALRALPEPEPAAEETP